MKRLSLPIFALLLSQNILSQGFLFDFESPNDLISIDTSVGNLWQIASPQKVFINSAFYGSKVIITDSTNSYPPNNQSAFVVKIPSSFVQNYGQQLFISFHYMINTDTFRDGGELEYSVDGGMNWGSSNNFDFGQLLTDTLFDGSPGLSGSSNGWSYISFYACNIWISNEDSLWLKFTFKSDSINNPKDGWALDDIHVQGIDCAGIEEINTNYHFVSVYPNPVSNVSFLQIKNQNQKIESIQFFNSLGVLVKTISHPHQNNFPVLKKDFPEGMYLYRVQLANGKRDDEKFVVE
ncbi:MAG TPA: T9SS type A sorting domain-containing protein [Chitinophagales bacterium]|nr:T9SS type A sorting domain-containing protein [Chitinophagales bacterium]